MQQAGAAQLIVRRTSSDWSSRKSTYQLFVDGALTGGLDQNETVEHTLKPGRHVLQVRYAWAKSKELVVEARPGDQIRAVVDPLPALVFVFYPPAYLQLHLENETV